MVTKSLSCKIKANEWRSNIVNDVGCNIFVVHTAAVFYQHQSTGVTRKSEVTVPSLELLLPWPRSKTHNSAVIVFTASDPCTELADRSVLSCNLLTKLDLVVFAAMTLDS